MTMKIDVETARRILSRALLNQSVNEHTAIEALNHLGGKMDLEHEVRYSKRSMLRAEMELLVHCELSRRINHLGGPLDLEKEVRYSRRTLTLDEIESAALFYMRRRNG